jgi:hypothetical protein
MNARDAHIRALAAGLPANVASLVELPAGGRPKALVWTGERVRAWQEDFDARLAAALAAAGRVSPVDIWISAPRPSPVMVWTPAQTMVFFAAARRHRLHALWRLITTRGLRRGEGCGLRRPDTDLDAALTTIRWQITQLGWDPVQGAPKSDAGERTVALDTDTDTDMSAWHRKQDKEKEAAGHGWLPGPAIAPRLGDHGRVGISCPFRAAGPRVADPGVSPVYVLWPFDIPGVAMAAGLALRAYDGGRVVPRRTRRRKRSGPAALVPGERPLLSSAQARNFGWPHPAWPVRHL